MKRFNLKMVSFIALIAFIYLGYKYKTLEMLKTLTYSVHRTGTKPRVSEIVLERLKRTMKISTTPTVEKMLLNLGFKNKTTPSGDFLFPDLPDPRVQTPDIPTIVTAASSNHFKELQAFLYNIDTILRPIYPKLKVIVYDIGFTKNELAAVIAYGMCEYHKFEFEKYPEHLRALQTCAWKPVIIQEVLNKHEFVLWCDVSIRFNKSYDSKSAFDKAKQDGHLKCAYRSTLSFYLITYNTFARTFEFFKENPSVFHGRHEIEAGFQFMVKNNLLSYVIMRTWLTCALQRECIMPKGAEHRTACTKPWKDHVCHRNDQSALGITCSLIYPQTDQPSWYPEEMFSVQRGTRMDYFKKLLAHRP